MVKLASLTIFSYSILFTLNLTKLHFMQLHHTNINYVIPRIQVQYSSNYY